MPFTFKKTKIPEVQIIEPRKFPDERGFFMETYKYTEFSNNGIVERFLQDNHSFSEKGILRGLHFQRDPYAQGKLVRVINGIVWDVAVDLRPSSATYKQWVGVELDGERGNMLYIPPGFGHGFVVLSDTAHFLYKCTNEYNPQADGGVRWDDPELNIHWPLKEVSVSAKDETLPFLKDIS